MLWTPSQGRLRVIHNNGIVGAEPGTAVTSNATTLLDGAVVELISAANNIQDSWGIEIFIRGTALSATASESCCDILVGGATDDVLIPALLCGGAGVAAGDPGCVHYMFPIHIPAGKRIAATLATVRLSVVARIAVFLYGGSPPPWRVGRKATALGTQVNNARGLAVAMAGGGAAASVTQIIASTAEDYFAFVPGFQIPVDFTWSASSGSINVGIGVGAATEQRIGTWFYVRDNGEKLSGPYPKWPAFENVPAGTRMVFYGSNSGTADSDNDGQIYAMS